MAPTGHKDAKITDASAAALQATRDILDAIHRHRDDEQPIFDIILQSAARLCDAPLAGLTLVNDAGDRLMVKSVWGDLDQRLPIPEDGFAVDSDVFPARAFRAAEVLHIADIRTLPEYVEGNPRYLALVEQQGFNAYLCVPLIMNGAPIGCLDLFRTTPEPFDDAQIALVETFATQAVIAIENARQFGEVQERLEREEATKKVLAVISASRDDEYPVFQAILEEAARLCDAPRAGLHLVAEAGETCRKVAGWGGGAVSAAQGAAFPVGNEWRIDDGTQAATTVIEARTILTDDIREDPHYQARHPIYVDMVEKGGIIPLLTVPLVKGGEGIGCIIINRSEPKTFDPKHVELVETFAAQAVIAIENVRQFREVQERLEREAASSEILQVISQSSDDELPVFDAILRNAARLCQLPDASLALVLPDGESFRFAAVSGARRKSFDVGDEFRLDKPHVVPTSIRECRTVQVKDLSKTDLYQSGDDVVVRLVDKEGLLSRLSAPLIKDGKAIGAIMLGRAEAGGFSEAEISLIETFAAQAVIAIENVRQFREVQERLERERASAEILEVISQSRDDDSPVLDAVLESAALLCDAPMASLNLVNDERTHMQMVAHRGDKLRHLSVGETVWPLDSGLSTVSVIHSGQPEQVTDLKDTELYRAGDEVRRQVVDEEGVRTFLAVPLMKGGQAVGNIALYKREVKPFSPDDIALVETFAAQAVIAIENVRQFREVQERLEREAATSEILEVISRSRDNETPVFQTVLRNARRLCKASTAALVLGRPDEAYLTLAALDLGDPDLAATTDERIALINSERIEMDPSVHVAARAICSGEVVHIADLTETEAYLSGERTSKLMVDDAGHRSILSVPLIDANGPIGAVNIHRQTSGLFHDDEIALVRSFADQAVIAIENVRQFREVQERLEREAATREILEVISRSRDDELPVFDAILEKAMTLCDATKSGLLLGRKGGDRLMLMALRDAHMSDAEREEAIYNVNNPPQMVDPKVHIAAQAICEARVVEVEDLATTPQYLSGNPTFKLMVEDMASNSMISVPLLDKDGAIGAINLHRADIRPFSADEIELVKGFAAQAAIAVENVRQFREVQERLERERASAEVLEVISRSRDDESPVFDVILKRASELCRTSYAGLALINEARTHLVYTASHGPKLAQSQFGDMQWALDGETSFAEAVRLKRPFQIEDMKESALYKAGDAQRVAHVDGDGIRTFLAVPMFQNGEVIGAFGLARFEVSPFSENDIELVKTFAAQAVIAIENVRQFRALETLNAELGERVDEQVGEIERMGRLKRFLPSAVADAVVTSGDESMLTSHRALVATLFCDMRGFTAFCESAEPEETIEVLQTYHQEMSELIDEYGGGVDQRAGDGIMVIFNDPIPVDDPAGDAVRLAIAMRDKMKELCAKWKRLGHRLGFGVGISLGYATVGMVGSAGRFDYTASGTSVNTAARLCDMAADGEILIAPRVWVAVEGDVEAESRGEVEMKGIREPVEVFAVR